MTAALDRAEAAATRSEHAAQQASEAEKRAIYAAELTEPIFPTRRYHSALAKQESRTITPHPVGNEHDAIRLAKKFLKEQKANWGKVSSVYRTVGGGYVVEFAYVRKDPGDLDGALIVDALTGNVGILLPR
jgi:hypothetical protein